MLTTDYGRTEVKVLKKKKKKPCLFSKEKKDLHTTLSNLLFSEKSYLSSECES